MKPIKTEKKLQLAKHTLRALDSESLEQVAGGSSLARYSCDESCNGRTIIPGTTVKA